MLFTTVMTYFVCDTMGIILTGTILDLDLKGTYGVHGSGLLIFLSYSLQHGLP